MAELDLKGYIELEEFSGEIEKWNVIIKSSPDLIDIAFFKVFVKFEKLILKMIVQYSIGEESSKNYLPERKLFFESSDHLRKTITDKQYIDVNNRVSQLCNQLFKTDNPFSFFFESSDQNDYKCMLAIRNYVAHESSESYDKYKKTVLNNMSDKDILPSQFLAMKKKQSAISYYQYYINILKIYAISFIDNNIIDVN